MGDTEEVVAIKAVLDAVSELEPAARHRVLRAAAEFYGQPLRPISLRSEAVAGSAAIAKSSSGQEESVFPDFATMFAAFGPKDGPERALVAGFWVQVCEASETFEGARVNAELKHLGHGLPNVTDALTSLIRRKPALVLQVRKSGKTRQARKKYKVTQEGIRYVEQRLEGQPSED